MNQNDIARDIEQGIRTSRYKDCIHLTILQPGPYGDSTFHTWCNNSSFEYLSMTVISQGKPKCPDDCHFFEAKAEVALQAKQQELAKEEEKKRERRKQNLLTVLKMIPAAFNWFAKLNVWTQLAIIFLLILAFAPSWIPPILKLIGIFEGK